MNNIKIERLKKYKAVRFKVLGLLLMVSLLSACANKVTVVADIPTPLVEKVPLNVHMSYTDEFKNHIYIENEKSRSLNSLNFAQAQQDMFDAIFGQLTTLVDAQSVSKDLTIEPEILDFQYTAPAETKLKQYEVWIKYRLKILGSDDAKVADWTIKGYGKTPTALLTSATKAFNSATNIALRDVGAQLATRFAGQRKIKALIDTKSGSQNSLAKNTALDGGESEDEVLEKAEFYQQQTENEPESANESANIEGGEDSE